jgi:hypothetical protein
MSSIDGKAKFLATLTRALEEGRAVAVYAEADNFQSYEVGFVEHVTDDELVLLCLTPKGEPDGRRVLRADDVARIDRDTTYTRKLELLFEYRESIFDNDFRSAPIGAADLRGQLEHARLNNTLVHLVDSSDYGPSGFVQVVGDDYVEIERIGNNGEPDGVATILLSGISKVHFARRQEQLLEFLHRYNCKLKRLLS